ncbi:MAG: protein kinase [Kofleriaceae bacterium]
MQRCPTDEAATEEVDRLPVGARLGAYKIERQLGEGGMGFVYEATHEVLGRRTAIKLLRPELAMHAEVVTRFLNEAKAVNVIDHQNIINVYDYGDGSTGCVYFVMEFLEGETLDDLMRKRRPMQMPLLLHVFAQVAKALAAAHAKRIVHRDLKPANVYVVRRANNPYFIKLLDFGIAQLRGEGAVHLTSAGSIMGTPQYMSPEQISGAAVDARTDVWAMGVMLYRAATGQAPFKGEGFGELAGKILHETPTPAGDLVDLPAPLAKLIARCLERRVEDRCQSMAELIAGLESVERACGLDADSIAAAVKLDSGAVSEALPVLQGDKTRGSLAGSLPQYQGVPKKGSKPAQKRSKLGIYAACGVAVAAVAVTAFVVMGRGDATASTPAPAVAPLAPVIAAPTTIRTLVAANDRAGARARAERELHDAIASGKPQQQGFAVDALARTRVPATAPLLYLALGAPPDVRVKAARALAELDLPDSVPKLRSALAESGDKLRVELASALYRLGDKDARAILVRATEDPAARLVAATALAEGKDASGRAVLAEIAASMPAGREGWRRATAGLAQLGDPVARAALEAELPQNDPVRVVAAAELLARGGDAKAREVLARVAADPEAPRAGDAALALAGLGDARAANWIARGLASSDAGDRSAAVAVCARLAAVAAHASELAALATDDPDHGVRMTARAALLDL